MLKQSLIYVLISILVVLFAKYLHPLLIWINGLYQIVENLLSPVFSSGGLGNTVCKIILLTLIPVVLAAIPALLYRVIKGGNMPHFIAVTWCFWLVVVLSHILVR